MATWTEPWPEEFPLPVITPATDIVLEQERRCNDVPADLAGRPAHSAGRHVHRSDPRAADLITEDSESIPPVMGGQGRSNYAALLSAIIAVLCIGGMGLIIAIAVVSSIVRWILAS